MKQKLIRVVCTITLLALALALAIDGQSAQSGAAGPAIRTAAQVYKNLQVLKDIPADRLDPAMRMIAASLNVECAHCHVDGAFEKDEKKPKLMARKMMQMQLAINKDTFNGQ